MELTLQDHVTSNGAEIWEKMLFLYSCPAMLPSRVCSIQGVGRILGALLNGPQVVVKVEKVATA